MFQSVGYCNCLVELHNYPIHVISKLLITQQPLIRTQQCSQINDIYSQFVKRVDYFLKLKLFKMLKMNRKLKTLSLKEKYEIIKKVQNGEIKNKTKFAEDVGIKRTTLSSIYAHSNKIIGGYEAGAITATQKNKKTWF